MQESSWSAYGEVPMEESYIANNRTRKLIDVIMKKVGLADPFLQKVIHGRSKSVNRVKYDAGGYLFN